MITKIAIAVGSLLVILAIVIATRPSEFLVSRTAVLAAPVATVFANVNDMHRWQEWSPWAKIDPNSKITYAGPAAGTDASFSWAGNQEVGEGKLTVVESIPPERIRFRLEFFKPFAGTNSAEFTFVPKGDSQTEVTWSMRGTNGFMAKAVGLVMDCDKMVGGYFEKGLKQLETVSRETQQP